VCPRAVLPPLLPQRGDMPQATRYNDLAAPRPTFRRDGEPPQADRTAQQTDEDADGDSIVNPLKGGSGRPERARWSGAAEGRWRAECSLREVTVRGFMKCGFFSPDTMLFAASGNCKLVLHSLATHRVIEELDYGHASVRAACVSPKMAGERYAFCVGTGDGSVHLYARSTGVAAGESDLVWSYQEDSKSTNCATFGKDGCVLAVGWVTGTVRLFDVLQGAATLPSAGNGGGAETVTPICEVSLGKSNINGGSLQFQSVGSAHYLAGSSPHSAQPIVNLWQLESAQDLKEPQA
jgi:WD40 repeat protein